MKAFEIKVNGKVLDYRIAGSLDLDEVRKFFQEKYVIKNLRQEGRHVLGILEHNGKEVFLKLATTEGISQISKIEFNWNEQVYKYLKENYKFSVPQNIDSGFYKDNLFYFIAKYLDGELLAKGPHPDEKFNELNTEDLIRIIELSELIQTFNIDSLSDKDSQNYLDYFKEKTLSWFTDIPENLRNEYRLNELMELIETGSKTLEEKPRHGDFAPWHLMNLQNGKLALIDGEHAMKNGVEYYDICFLIERIFVVLENPNLAKKIFEILVERKYDVKKLKILLASRVIGAFLDSSIYFETTPDFTSAEKFKNWVLSL